MASHFKSGRSGTGWRHHWRRLKSYVGRSFEFLGNILIAPIKLLFLPARAIELFHERGIQLENESRRTRRRRQNLAHQILGFPVRVLLLPTTLYHLARRRGKLKELWYFVPALLIIVLFSYVWYQKTFRFSGLHQKYLARTRQAVDSNKNLLAKMYFARILQEESTLSDAQSLHWAVILGRTGDKKRASDVLNRIAPDKVEGYAPAHRVKAINLGQRILDGENSIDLDQMAFHLKHAGEADPELKRTWAIYYEEIGNSEKAIRYLNEASQVFPDLYLAIAEIAERTSQKEVREEALTNARYAFTKLLNNQPLNIPARISLARCLMAQENYREAEKILYQGILIQPTPVLRRSLSNLYMISFDRVVQKENVNGRIKLIKQGIEIDPESEATYQRLVELCSQATTPEELDKLKRHFQEIVANFGSGALDHCNLAYCYYRENNQQEQDWHLSQAWRIDPGFGVQAHRLGLAFAKSQEFGDSDWALKIVRLAAIKALKEAAYREALAEVHLIREEFREAISILNETLKDTLQPAEIHQRLAYAHQQIGEFKRAGLHRQKATEAQLTD